jgi:hypothetical protein
MQFARRVFFWSGLYGFLVLVPAFFLEERIGRDFPPATNHPEQYYAFLAVALAWQWVFVLVAREPIRYRPLMLPAIAEKFLPAGVALWLFSAARIDAVTALAFLPDLAIGALFIASYVRSRDASAQGADSPA